MSKRGNEKVLLSIDSLEEVSVEVVDSLSEYISKALGTEKNTAAVSNVISIVLADVLRYFAHRALGIFYENVLEADKRALLAVGMMCVIFTEALQRTLGDFVPEIIATGGRVMEVEEYLCSVAEDEKKSDRKGGDYGVH